jgi:hypothetical protein
MTVWSVIALTVIGVAGCGKSTSPTTKAGWTKDHGASVATLSTQLDFARSALDKGDRQAILSACNLLRDDLADTRKALPVPNAGVDTALRQALGSVTTGVADCLQGARVASVASIVERAMAELGDARTRLDGANRAIASWQ